jgi:hypothetical protein
VFIAPEPKESGEHTILAKVDSENPGIDRLSGFGPWRGDLSISIGVHDAWTPALEGFGIMGLVPSVDVHPTDGCCASAHSEVEKIVRADLVWSALKHVLM